MKVQQYYVEESEEQQFHKTTLKEKPLECMRRRKVSKEFSTEYHKWKSDSI